MIDLLDFLGVVLGLEAMGVIVLIAVLLCALIALLKGSLLIAGLALVVAVAMFVYGAGVRRKANEEGGGRAS